MEKCIQKGSFYGFLVCLALAFLFVDYKVITPFDGGYTTEYVPVYDYIVSIIRFGVSGAFIGMFVGWMISKIKNEDNK
ncbi:hypothetical protein [Ammoniphilus resinae]|uniref:Uncharacterized protein n=1 Tax=Ammoniphilus resinae TaxID=861532 RepID=A0ABS4GP19_9BACL|nr:hypothetical protein [Ammoniphilus resinae]MBP1932014.1 hypothetical protein [Ammoniphilus resinae]